MAARTSGAVSFRLPENSAVIPTSARFFPYGLLMLPSLFSGKIELFLQRCDDVMAGQLNTQGFFTARGFDYPGQMGVVNYPQSFKRRLARVCESGVA